MIIENIWMKRHCHVVPNVLLILIINERKILLSLIVHGLTNGIKTQLLTLKQYQEWNLSHFYKAKHYIIVKKFIIVASG